MGATQRTIVLQTGRQTPADSLLRDLAAIEGIFIDARRLGTSFLGGGVASFILIAADNVNTSPLADALYQHLKRLKVRGDDDLVILLGGVINTTEEEVGFRDVRCRRHVSLKGKSQDEIKEILEEALAEAM